MNKAVRIELNGRYRQIVFPGNREISVFRSSEIDQKLIEKRISLMKVLRSKGILFREGMTAVGADESSAMPDNGGRHACERKSLIVSGMIVKTLVFTFTAAAGTSIRFVNKRDMDLERIMRFDKVDILNLILFQVQSCRDKILNSHIGSFRVTCSAKQRLT